MAIGSGCTLDNFKQYEIAEDIHYPNDEPDFYVNVGSNKCFSSESYLEHSLGYNYAADICGIHSCSPTVISNYKDRNNRQKVFWYENALPILGVDEIKNCCVRIINDRLYIY